MNLSEHFTREEFVRSRSAAVRGIPNDPSHDQWEVIEVLCDAVLEPARKHVGPLNVVSGYRCRALNLLVLGEPASDHMVLGRSCAADIVVPSGHMADLFRTLHALPWSRLIWEYGGQWVHVSWCMDGRLEGRRPQRKDYGRPYRAMDEAEIAELA